MFRKILPLILIAFAPAFASAQKVIPLYPGAAPGSEDWNWQERENALNGGKDVYVSNVVKPTLTIFGADPATANGTAVVVCPGGGYYVLAMSSEGTDVARWLNKQGITVFVLKYRLTHTTTANPGQEFMTAVNDPAKLMAVYSKIIPLSVADGKQALAYVRGHAGEYHINPDKIGIIGFSAGGGVAAGASFNYTPASKPNFVAPFYPYVPPGGFGAVPADAPPMFLAVASDDEFHLVPTAIDLYNKWHNNGHEAELHIYEKGGHGFDMRKRNLPVDSWTDRLLDWLRLNGLLGQVK